MWYLQFHFECAKLWMSLRPMLVLLLILNAVGRPHFDFKNWRISGQMHSIHGTPRLTRGFLITRNRRLPRQKPRDACSFPYFIFCQLQKWKRPIRTLQSSRKYSKYYTFGISFYFPHSFLLPRFFNLQIPCVIVPIGQNTHHVLGLNKTITISPIKRDVSIRL